MGEWTKYHRIQIAELRPYVPGEPEMNISISAADLENGSPRSGDMIARNPENHADQWLIAERYFNANFEPVANETGLTPQQLADRVRQLEEALEAIRDIPKQADNYGAMGAAAGYWFKVLDIARAALSQKDKQG